MKLVIHLAVLLLTVGPCVGYTNGDLRLTGSSSGILQIYKNNEWRIVCSDDWGHLDAAVACRQLGYDGGYTQSTSSYSSNSEEITVDPVEYHCNGRESNLQTCDNETNSRCSYYDVTTIACVQRNMSDPCSSGDIRLWGGETEYEGNIEICTDHGVWSAVCDSSWGTPDATVACRQLNYMNTISLSYSRSVFGQRIQPVEYGGLDCQGTESSLQQCAVSRIFVDPFSKLFFCNQRDYAGVRCIPKTRATCRNGAVRLTGGYSANNGFAEICLDGVWIGICLHSSTQISMHICKQLGYPRYTRIDQTFFLANRSEPLAYTSFRDYQCRSESSVLLDCVYNSTTYGISYRSTCTPHGILCCPNNTASCGFQLKASDDLTTSPTTPTPMIPPTDLTLSQTVVKMIHKLSNLAICASCSFTAGSEAEGCAVELESEAHTYLFNMSRSTSGGGELSGSVLDCFTVGEAGGYSVHVYEIQHNGELGHRRKELPDVTVEGETSVTVEGDTSGKENRTQPEEQAVVTCTLPVMLSLALVGITLIVIVVTISVIVICIKKQKTKQSTTSVGNKDANTNTMTASPPENLDTPTIHYYEQVDLKRNYEEIELSSNTSYGVVKK